MKTLHIISIILVLVVSINALVAGYLFISVPDGSALGANVSLLRFSPFNNFLIPGIILFTVNGVLNLFTAVILLMKRPKRYAMLLLQGVLLSGWIAIQVWMLREFNFLHLIFGSIGLFFIVVSVYLQRSIIPTH